MHNLTLSFILEQAEQSNRSGAFDAVVLFVDTSGFTPLTVRLTEQGLDGAEVLADILQAVFEPLVAAVYAHGGFIAGFAGDAFKAVFRGLEAESYLHALATAEQIRTHMAANPSHQTKVGTFDFSVRMSIADGEVIWAVWTSDIEEAAQQSGYTFSGLAIAQAIEGEDHADGGELVVTQSVYDALLAAQAGIVAGRPLTDAAAGYVHITEMAGRLPTAKTEVDAGLASSDHTSHFYPSSLLATKVRGEFRPVYTLFINVQRLPNPGANDDFLPLFFQLLHQYGGYLCRIGRIGANDPGGTFLLFWGAPTSHENDLARVLSFGLALQSQVDIPLRGSITHAVVYAGFVGSQLREEYTCYGSRVNQAARQMTTAAWGQILLDAESAQRAQDDFEVTLAGHFALKGLTEEQALFAVTGHRAQTAGSAYQSDFIGREREITQLQRAIQPIFSGTRTGRFGGITVVRGEAGIGKSRLVHEFLMMTEALENVQVIVGQVDEILRESLNPFRYFLRRYFEQSPTADEATNRERFDETLDALIATTMDEALSLELVRTRSFLGALVNLHWPDSLYAQVEPQLRHENALTTLKTLIKAESLRQPLILLLEDGQWLDADTLAFLARLARNVDDYPFAILITARPTEDEWLGDEGMEDRGADGEGEPILPPELIQQEILVEPLAEAEVAALAHDYLGTAAATALVQLLTARAEGNPFFVEQMLLYLQEQGLLVDEAAGWQLVDKGVGSESVMPMDIQSVLVARLDRLTQEVKQVVQTAAVLGREFSVQILSQMLREEVALDDKVQSAEAAAVWNAVSEIRYLFRHALLRDAAYDMQLRARLRALHALAAAAIEQLYSDNLPLHYPDLAYHYHHAELMEKEREFAELSGRQAVTQYAASDALTFLTRALDLTPEDAHEERYGLLALREDVYKLRGDRIAQQQNLEEMSTSAEALTNPTYQAEVQLAYAEFYEGVSDFSASVLASQRAIELAEASGNITLQTDGYERWGRALWPQGQYHEAQAKAQQALGLARSAGLRKQEANALVGQGIAYWFLGDYAAAQIVLEQSLPIYVELELRFAQYAPLVNLALIAQNLDEHDKALAYLQQSLALNQERGARKEQAIASTNMGVSYKNLGNYIQAMETQSQALALFREIDDRFGQIVARANLASIAIELGDYRQAREHLIHAVEQSRTIGSRGQEASLLAILSEVDLAEDQPLQALTTAQEAVQIANEVGHRDTEAKTLFKLGNVLLAQQQFSKAATAYEDTLAIRSELNESKRSMEALAGLAKCALQQNNQSTAMSHVHEILTFLETGTLDDTFAPFSIYLTCYHALSRNGPQDVQRAHAILTTAYELLHVRASKISDETMRYSFLNNVAIHRDILNTYTEVENSS